jgi:undecaprenyl-diphosphatase
VLTSLLVLAMGFWVFLGLANLVSAGATRQVDEWMVRAVRHPDNPALPRGPQWLPEAVRDVTAMGSTTVLTMITAAAAGFLAMRRQYQALLLLLAAIGGGLLLNWLLKGFFDRPRPDLVPHLMLVRNPSFPSGHSLLSAVVYLTIGALLARLVEPLKFKIYILGVALAFSFLIGLSRIYLGVHYPSDVLAGWTVGLLWAIVCWLSARELQRRGAMERGVLAQGSQRSAAGCGDSSSSRTRRNDSASNHTSPDEP